MKSGSHAPHRIRASGRCDSAKSVTKEVLPIPASPQTSTIAPLLAHTRLNVLFINSKHSKDNCYLRFENEILANEYVLRNHLKDKGITQAYDETSRYHYLVKGENIFAPANKIKLPVDSLKKMVRVISFLLAQPLRKGWPNNAENLIKEQNRAKKLYHHMAFGN